MSNRLDLGGGVYIERVMVTPEEAASLTETLERAQQKEGRFFNRDVDRQHVLDLADIMAALRWATEISRIVVSKDGLPIDGQHTCHAIVEHGKPVECLVIRGVRRELAKDIDQQDRSRTKKQGLAIRFKGVGDYGKLDTGLRFVANLCREERKSRFTMLEVEHIAKEWKSDVQCIVEMTSTKSYDHVRIKEVFGVLAFAHKANPRKVEEFVRALMGSEGVPPNHPARRLYDYLLTSHQELVRQRVRPTKEALNSKLGLGGYKKDILERMTRATANAVFLYLDGVEEISGHISSSPSGLEHLKVAVEKGGKSR